MSQRAKEISERIKDFSDNVIAFVESLSEDDWRKVCESEEWPVGATAYHLGAGHFAISDTAGMIVRGEDLPPLTMDQINAMSDNKCISPDRKAAEIWFKYLKLGMSSFGLV